MCWHSSEVAPQVIGNKPKPIPKGINSWEGVPLRTKLKKGLITCEAVPIFLSDMNAINKLAIMNAEKLITVS